MTFINEGEWDRGVRLPGKSRRDLVRIMTLNTVGKRCGQSNQFVTAPSPLRVPSRENTVLAG